MICLHHYPFCCYSFITRCVMSGRIFECLAPGALWLQKDLSPLVHLHKFPIFWLQNRAWKWILKDKQEPPSFFLAVSNFNWVWFWACLQEWVFVSGKSRIRAQLMTKQSHTTTVKSKFMSRHLLSGCTVPCHPCAGHAGWALDLHHSKSFQLSTPPKHEGQMANTFCAMFGWHTEYLHQSSR